VLAKVSKWLIVSCEGVGIGGATALFAQQCLYFLPLPQGHGAFLPTATTDIFAYSIRSEIIYWVIVYELSILEVLLMLAWNPKENFSSYAYTTIMVEAACESGDNPRLRS